MTEARLGVGVAGTVMALNLADIAEIARVPACSPVPNGPRAMVGLVQLRGTIVPVLSLAALLGHDRLGVLRQSRLIVLAGASPVGLLVDSVSTLQDDAQAPIDTASLLAGAFGMTGRSAVARRGQVAAPHGVAAPPPQVSHALVGLRVGHQEFALPLPDVTEITRLPETIAIVPHANTAMLGAIGFRGGLLPLVSLGALLGFPAASPPPGSRVVALGIGTTRLGLVVDAVTGTLAIATDAIDLVPPLLARADGDAMLAGICRLAGGRRLIGLLDTANLFDADTIAQLSADGRDAPARDDAIAAETVLAPFVLFALTGQKFGLPLEVVDEVVRRPQSLAPLPHARPAVLGAMSLRGRVLPVIDTAHTIGIHGSATATRIIVVSIDGRQAGLAVDSVDGMLRVAQADLRAAPALDTSEDAMFDRVALRRDGDLILLLSPKALLLALTQERPGPSGSALQ